MRIVVTGAGGFLGWHLVTALALRGDVVEAWLGRPSSGPTWSSGVVETVVDITDAVGVAKRLQSCAPDVLVHLAAQSLPGLSWQDPARTYLVNVGGTLNLLEAARMMARPPRLLLAGSSAEYAEPDDGRMIAEGDPTKPNSPYGASKLAVNDLASLYESRYGLNIVRFRPFFIIGPRKVGDVASDFARRIVHIEQGGTPVMRVGRLDVVRDIMDVRDGVAAVVCLIDHAEHGGVYNICSGSGVSISDILATYIRLASRPFEVLQDPDLLRSLDQKAKIGDPARLLSLGWSPRHEMSDTLTTILDSWRAIPAV